VERIGLEGENSPRVVGPNDYDDDDDDDKAVSTQYVLQLWCSIYL
jgi:hypothetical protein